MEGRMLFARNAFSSGTQVRLLEESGTTKMKMGSL
jgi:hypothetical protein